MSGEPAEPSGAPDKEEVAPNDTGIDTGNDAVVQVLVVEDDFAIREAVFKRLRDEGCEVMAVIDGETALKEGLAGSFDVIVLDLGLPKRSGFEVIRGLRSAGKDTPIIVITGFGSSSDCVAGLEAGADDYLVKPFRLDELHARVHAQTRRYRAQWNRRTALGPLEFDRHRRAFYVNSAPLLLSRRESEILAALMHAPGDIVRKQTLVANLSHWDHSVTPNLVEVYVHKLRRRLAEAGVEINTIRGLGYVIGLAESDVSKSPRPPREP
jgi:DNA-binding response OmpR family regulator